MLFLILLGFLLYPPAVLAEIRVDFEDESYGMGRHWKALASFSEHAGLDSVKDTITSPEKRECSSGICVTGMDVR